MFQHKDLFYKCSDFFLISACMKNFDVMAFQESRLNSNIASSFQLPGYSLYTQCRNTEGIFLFLIFTVHLYYLTSVLPKIIQSVLLLRLNVLMVFIYYASMYPPPIGKMPKFITRLNDLLMLVSDKNYRGIYLLGDWIIDLLNTESNPVVCQFVNFMYSFSYTALITKPTRVTDNYATLIDNIWSTEVRNSILYTDITDHFPVIFYFSSSKIMTRKKIVISKRILCNINIDKIVQNVTDAN